MARTERVPATCAVKEYADGVPFLIFEMGFLPSLPQTYIGLDLRAGTTAEQAQKVADMINDHCENLAALLLSQA